jgi:hypothetical protein
VLRVVCVCGRRWVGWWLVPWVGVGASRRERREVGEKQGQGREGTVRYCEVSVSAGLQVCTPLLPLCFFVFLGRMPSAALRPKIPDYQGH